MTLNALSRVDSIVTFSLGLPLNRFGRRFVEPADWLWVVSIIDRVPREISSISSITTIEKLHKKIPNCEQFVVQAFRLKDDEEAIKNTWRFCPTFHEENMYIDAKARKVFIFQKIGNFSIRNESEKCVRDVCFYDEWVDDDDAVYCNTSRGCTAWRAQFSDQQPRINWKTLARVGKLKTAAGRFNVAAVCCRCRSLLSPSRNGIGT